MEFFFRLVHLAGQGLQLGLLRVHLLLQVVVLCIEVLDAGLHVVRFGDRVLGVVVFVGDSVVFVDKIVVILNELQ